MIKEGAKNCAKLHCEWEAMFLSMPLLCHVCRSWQGSIFEQFYNIGTSDIILIMVCHTVFCLINCESDFSVNATRIQRTEGETLNVVVLQIFLFTAIFKLKLLVTLNSLVIIFTYLLLLNLC